MNWLDCICCISILGHCIAALYFNDPEFIKENLRGARSLDTILVVMNCICFASILGLFCVNLTEHRFRALSVETIARGASELAVSLQTELVNHRDTLLRELGIDGSPEAPKKSTVFLADFKRAAQICLEESSLQASSPAALEALYYILKVACIDDDRASLFLSLQMRAALTVDEGVPIRMVLLPFLLVIAIINTISVLITDS